MASLASGLSPSILGFVKGRNAQPMMPLQLFKSSTFLPFALLLTAMSRWAGGLVDRIGPRLPLIIEPTLPPRGLTGQTNPFMEKLFAVTAPGLEAFTRQELDQTGIWPLKELADRQTLQFSKDSSSEETGGVLFEGDLRAIYQANLILCTASRVLVRFGEFYAAAFSELEKKSSRLAWERYLAPGQPVAVRVTCHKSRLYHSDAVARTLVKGIGNRLNQPPALLKFDENGIDDPPQLIVARLTHDKCTISINSSGSGLHRRGYRLAAAKAPLRENLAAAMIMASSWDGVSPLIDPFCGSGTIPIEAAMMARRIPAGGARRFAFFNWPDFDRVLWESLLTNPYAR